MCVVDHDCARVVRELLLLEKLAIHPLDMSRLFSRDVQAATRVVVVDELDASPARGRGATRGVGGKRAMTLREAGVPMGRADDGAPSLLGCVVTTKTATCLVNATVPGSAGRLPCGGAASCAAC